MKVAILGSWGIPNRYGGFEELAEKLAVGLADRGNEVIVYNPSDHPLTEWKHQGVSLIRIFNPEGLLGSFGQFIYDLGASIHARSAKPDIILQLGYTSSSIWYWVLPRKSRIITNMDGLEWKRSKYSWLVKKFLKRAEKWAARHSHLLVADHPAIEAYLHERYASQVIGVSYGATIPEQFTAKTLAELGLKPNQFDLLIARIEPENHIKEIVQGVKNSNSQFPLVVVGGINKHAQQLIRAFNADKRIHFVGAIYDKQAVNDLRHYARYYFHGHSVGGTNPSLLEAMACGCNIIAHNNVFNKGVLNGQAEFFTTANDVSALLNSDFDAFIWEKRQRKNVSVIRDKYNWRIIVEQYEIAMQQTVL